MPRDIDHPDLTTVTLEQLLSALADPVRLAIVRLAATEADLPCAAFLDQIPKSTMSHHWRVLREAGLIRQTPDGPSRRNSLRKAEVDARFPGVLDAVLATDCELEMKTA